MSNEFHASGFGSQVDAIDRLGREVHRLTLAVEQTDRRLSELLMAFNQGISSFNALNMKLENVVSPISRRVERASNDWSINDEIGFGTRETWHRTVAEISGTPEVVQYHMHLKADTGFEFGAECRLVRQKLDGTSNLEAAQIQLLRLGWKKGDPEALHHDADMWVGSLIPEPEGGRVSTDGPLLLLPPGSGGEFAVWVENSQPYESNRATQAWQLIPLRVDRSHPTLRYIVHNLN